MTAAAIAGELKLPLFTVLYDGLIHKLLGETAKGLRLIFDAIGLQRGVYFFDEFDAIGALRAGSNDVGEIRRVLNDICAWDKVGWAKGEPVVTLAEVGHDEPSELA